MIRDAVIHLLNEQPLVADLLAPPSPTDSVLICTNLRTTNRKRPAFVDQVASTFAIPYAHVRFIEMPPGIAALPDGREVPASAALEDGEPELELDEDLLRRVREL